MVGNGLSCKGGNGSKVQGNATLGVEEVDRDRDGTVAYIRKKERNIRKPFSDFLLGIVKFNILYIKLN